MPVRDTGLVLGKLNWAAPSVVLAVADGHPALGTAGGGYGLAGMRERLLLIEGSLRAGPDDGNWVVSAPVPQ